MRYAWIETQRDCYPLKLLCRVLQVTRSGYYAWRRRGPSHRVQRREQIGQAADWLLRAGGKLKFVPEWPGKAVAQDNAVVEKSQGQALSVRLYPQRQFGEFDRQRVEI